ncbi:PQQ-like beta-propeller repeat protein [Taklimakanibacter albus]|uniref:PQQ-binding-like beta-propeller repeat protein n=1 Tax=Taklimakanibacter albus TaxID=2800327 RepID=A0ACC5R0G5_9HYPH|nr:PQQ-like beta-propeller repeat protein [Aestuariivirga sp. YIM B02566]MBK1865956.1 PQQ-binding-like beta-propeller repeat protein [Aestuariivirga sp. YIM B02566]
MRFSRLWPILATSLFLTGCGSASKLLEGVTGEKDVVLPGKRESVLSPSESSAPQNETSGEPIVIPTAETNSSWAQPGGQATNSFGNLSAGATLSRAWATSAGEGSTGDGRIVASPIIVGGTAYVLDSRSNVTAIRTSGGGQAWRVSLVPEGKSTRAFGGGLASDGQRIYATSVFGEALALDASTGAILWRKKLGAPVRAAPTVANGTIYFTGSSNEVFALRASDGTEVWKYQGTGGRATIASSPSPAVSQGFVVIPTTAGEIIAFNSSDGLEAWSDALTSNDPAATATNIGSVAGRPVIEGGQVFAISNAGRMAAFALQSGDRQWTRDISGSQTPWVAGDHVFVIINGKTLMALSRRTGAVRWSKELPGKIWAGPVLGGGRLLAVSSDGQLASISAQTGEVLNTIKVGDSFYIAPVIANGTVYLLSDDAQLIALR